MSNKMSELLKEIKTNPKIVDEIVKQLTEEDLIDFIKLSDPNIVYLFHHFIKNKTGKVSIFIFRKSISITFIERYEMGSCKSKRVTLYSLKF